MLQYLLNVTAIWLISLVLFDVFLRRESYHGYNRFYLLVTFVLGLVLPLWDGSASNLQELPALRPVQRITEARESIITSAANSSLVDHINWWWFIYAVGVFIAFVVLVADVVKLVRLYHGGTISYQDDLMIVETGRSHTPFSFLKMVFVESKDRYNAQEWQTVIGHERRHATFVHLADVLLMQLSRLFFWFHPLVYLYNNRLLTVHEYQADRESAIQPQHYGQFLIEQALLHSSPVITHAFNRSPIKKRILMLSRKSGTIAYLKMLVFIPLVLVSFICFSQKIMTNSFVADEYGFVKLSNNQLEFSKTNPDTIEMEMEDGSVTKKIVKKDPVVLRVDGKALEMSMPVFKDNSQVDEYIYKKLSRDLSQLEDGEYFVGVVHVIVDDKGRTCAFTYQGIMSDSIDRKGRDRHPVKIDKQLETKIFSGLCKELSAIRDWQPPVVNGRKVPSVFNFFGGSNYYPLRVKQHKLYIVQDGRTNTWTEL